MQELQSFCSDYSDRKQTLLLEILTQGDDKVLSLISDNPGSLKELLDTYGDSPGMLWEELVIRFEWSFEIKKVYEDSNMTEEIKAVVEEAEKGIKFEFSEQMVTDWIASLTQADNDDGLFESLMKFVSSRE